MKHAWILNHYALAPSDAGGTRHYSLAAHLRSYGWDATIIAASVEHNSNRQRLAAAERQRHEVLDGVPFLWLKTPGYKGNGVSRMCNMLAYTARALLPHSTGVLPRPDAIIGSSVHPFAALAGAILARRHRVPFVFEVRDLWPQTLIDLGRLDERSPMTLLLRRLERMLYVEATRIVTLLPHAADYIEGLRVDRRKVVWIPNGVELSARDPAAPRLRGPGEPFVLMYFGAHGNANGLEHVVRAVGEAASRLPPGALRLRLIGDGPLKNDLKQLAASLRLDNVSFEPPVPKSAIPRLAAEADAFVISVLDRPRLYKYGISMNKLFDYLAAERPVLIASGAQNNPIAEAGAGISVPPADIDALSNAIITIIRTPDEERHRMGRAGRHFVESHHSFGHLAARLAHTLDACTNETAATAQHA